MENKPRMMFWQIWNFGFLGIQTGSSEEVTPNAGPARTALHSPGLDSHGIRIFKGAVTSKPEAEFRTAMYNLPNLT